MNALGYIVAACLLIAAAQAVAVTIVLGIYLAVIIGVFMRPRETFSLLAFLLLAYLLQTHPLPSLSVVALLAIATIVNRPTKTD